MNLGELPFFDMMWSNRVAGVHLETMTMCLNRAAWFEDELVNQKIEQTCEGLITHETIHAILNEVVGLGKSPEWDVIDGDPNYTISIFVDTKQSEE